MVSFSHKILPSEACWSSVGRPWRVQRRVVWWQNCYLQTSRLWFGGLLSYAFPLQPLKSLAYRDHFFYTSTSYWWLLLFPLATFIGVPVKIRTFLHHLVYVWSRAVDLVGESLWSPFEAIFASSKRRNLYGTVLSRPSLEALPLKFP